MCIESDVSVMLLRLLCSALKLPPRLFSDENGEDYESDDEEDDEEEEVSSVLLWCIMFSHFYQTLFYCSVGSELSWGDPVWLTEH